MTDCRVEVDMAIRVLTRRPLAAASRIGIVVAMHVAVIYVIANALGIPIVPLPNHRIEAVVEQLSPIIDELPLAPAVKLLDPEPRVLPPEASYDDQPEPTTSDEVMSLPTAQGDAATLAGGSAVPQPLLVPASADLRFPLTQPDYPPSARRLEQQGVAVIAVLVAVNGRVADARIVTSSGHTVLDEAALLEAKRRWRLRPATRDGVPHADWYSVRVVFRIAD
jgi:protein TonB